MVYIASYLINLGKLVTGSSMSFTSNFVCGVVGYSLSNLPQFVDRLRQTVNHSQCVVCIFIIIMVYNSVYRLLFLYNGGKPQNLTGLKWLL